MKKIVILLCIIVILLVGCNSQEQIEYKLAILDNGYYINYDSQNPPQEQFDKSKMLMFNGKEYVLEYIDSRYDETLESWKTTYRYMDPLYPVESKTSILAIYLGDTLVGITANDIISDDMASEVLADKIASERTDITAMTKERVSTEKGEKFIYSFTEENGVKISYIVNLLDNLIAWQMDKEELIAFTQEQKDAVDTEKCEAMILKWVKDGYKSKGYESIDYGDIVPEFYVTEKGNLALMYVLQPEIDNDGTKLSDTILISVITNIKHS